jgi:hypothetical protein
MLFILVFITTSIFAQKEIIYKKSFDTNSQTILVLDLKKTPVIIEESMDGKIHFDYSIDFNNYSKRKMRMISKQVKVKVTVGNDKVKLTSNSSEFLGVTYFIDTKLGLVLEDKFFDLEKKKKRTYKSKDSLLREIKDRGVKGQKQFINNIKTQDEKGNRKRISIKNIKSIKSVFKIRVPSNIRIKIKGESSQILLNYDMNVSLEADLDRGSIKTKKLTSENTNITVRNGVFEAEAITRGRYILKDVSKCLIGEASHTVIDSEGSKVEVGEIGKKVIVKDFNSEFFFYNFSKDFKEFNIKGDYSKLHFYDKKHTFSLTAFGNTTAINFDDQKFSFEPRKGKKKFKMLEKKVKKKENYFGHVDLNITNGIIEIKSIEKE